MKLTQKRGKLVLLVALLLSFIMVVTNLVSVLAQSSTAKVKDENSITLPMSRDDLGIENSIIEGKGLISILSEGANAVGWAYTHQFTSKVGELSIVRKNPNGTYSAIELNEYTFVSYDFDGNEYEEISKVQEWGVGYPTFEEALSVATSATDYSIYSSVKSDEYTGTLGDYLSSTTVYVVSNNKIVLECNFDEFTRCCFKSVKSEDMAVKVSFVDYNKYQVEVINGGTLYDIQDVLPLGSVEYIQSIEIYQSSELLVHDTSVNIASYEINTEIINDLQVVVRTSTRSDKLTFNISSLLPEPEMENTSIVEVYPNLSVSGIPSGIVNEAFEVSLSTDIPCKLYTYTNHDLIGETDGQNSIKYKVDKGNGVYKIICQPTLSDTDIVKHLESEESFEITCFSDDFNGQVIDKFPPKDDIVLDEDEAIIDGGTTGGDSLAPTGVNAGTRLIISVVLFTVLGLIFLALYKKNLLKKLFAFFLVVTLVVGLVPFVSLVATVEVEAAEGDNDVVSGNVDTSGARPVGSGDLSLHAFPVTYMIYPVVVEANSEFESNIYYKGWVDQKVRYNLNNASTKSASLGFMLYHGNIWRNPNMPNEETLFSGVDNLNYHIIRNFSIDGKDTVLAMEVNRVAMSEFNSRLRALELNIPILKFNCFTMTDMSTDSIKECMDALDDASAESLTVKANILNTLFPGAEYTESTCADVMIAVEICESQGIGGNAYSLSSLTTNSFEHRYYDNWYHDAIDGTGNRLTKCNCDALKAGLKGLRLPSDGTTFDLGDRCVMSTVWNFWYNPNTQVHNISVTKLTDTLYNSRFRGNDVTGFTQNSNLDIAQRVRGVAFVLSETPPPPKIVYEYEYNYTLLSRSSVSDFKTDATALPFNSSLIRRVVEKTDDVVTKTWYNFYNPIDKIWSVDYPSLDTLISKISGVQLSGNSIKLTDGYVLYGDVGSGFVSVDTSTTSDFYNKASNPNITYKYTGTSVTGSNFNAGKSYEYSQSKDYKQGVKDTIGGKATSGSLASSILTKDNYKLGILSLVDMKNYYIGEDHSSPIANTGGGISSTYSVEDTFDSSSWFTSDKNGRIPVLYYSEYKAPSVTSKVYEVELTISDGKYIPSAPVEVKNLTYEVDSSDTYVIENDFANYVIVSSGSINTSVQSSGVSSLTDLDNYYGTVETSGLASKNNDIQVGATTSGTGYNIYVFLIKGVDNLNMSKNYTLEPYMLNRLYAGLDSNGRVYTLTGADLNCFDGSSTINKADLYQVGLGGATFINGLTSAGIKNTGTGIDNCLNNAITYSTSGNHKIVTGYNTSTGYKNISILDSYALALSRGVKGDNKILSSIAVGTDKTTIDGISSANRTKFNLGYGLKGAAPNSAYDTISHNNHTFDVDVNTLQIEGRYPYNYVMDNTYMTVIPTASGYDNVKYDRTINGGVVNNANYLLGYSGASDRFRTLNFTANVIVKSYNSGALSEGKANVNKELLSTADKLIYATDNNTHLKFYPEVYMMYYTSPTSTCKVPVMGEYERKVQGSSLYGFKISTLSNVTGKTVSDMTSTSGATYRGSDVTLVIKDIGTKFEAFGYSLDIVNKDTDTINNSIVGNNNVYTAWGNSGTATTLKNEFNAWLSDKVKDLDADTIVDVKLDLSNGKSYSDFDVSVSGITMDSASTVNDMTWAITVKNGSIIEDTSFNNLINQIATDFGISNTDAKIYFANSNIAKSIIDSMETCVNSKNTSDKQESITAGSHWYDEFTRTFVIRRFSNNTVQMGSITVQDKIDMNANTSTIVGSGINQTIKGNDVKADWKVTVKRNNGTVFNNVKVSGASFNVSYLTTED